MAKPRGTSVAPNGVDIINTLTAFREDTGCEGRIILRLAPGDSRTLLLAVESYTDAGTKLGVARDTSEWSERSRWSLIGQIMGLCHRVYHTTCERAQRHL